MKRSAKILGGLLLGVGLLAIAGCGKGPTQPAGGGREGGGGPGGVDISGAWNGTVTDSVGSCPPENFSVVLSQSAVDQNGFQGGKAVGSFATPCQGVFALQLYVNGEDGLLGSVAGKGHVSGHIVGGGLAFDIIGGQGGIDNGQFVVAQVSMTR